MSNFEIVPTWQMLPFDQTVDQPPHLAGSMVNFTH